MHRPAAVEAALSTERRGECSHTTSQPYSAAARAPVYPEARELRWTRKGVVFQQHYRLLLAFTGVRGVLPVCFLLSDVWLSSLPGVGSCGGRHSPGSRSGLLVLFVSGFRVYVSIADKPRTSPADSCLLGLLFAVRPVGGSESSNLPVSSSLLFLASKRSVWIGP